MKYGFIGCGNMGGAIARCVARSTKDILLSDPSPLTPALAEELGGICGSNEDAASCDRLVLGVKPHMMKGMLAPLQGILAEKKPLIITMAAGLEIAQIEQFAGTRLPIIRIMPNTPVGIGSGVILHCHNELVDQETLQDVLNDLRFAGIVSPLEERLIDAGSALSGSSPAFVYMFIEALADGAVACGIPRAKAMEYAAATVVGAGKMVLENGAHPGALKDAVCSPGGSTIAGVRTLEQHGFRGSVIDCVIDTYNRNKELGK